VSVLRHLIVADGDFGPMTSKTANSVIRYQPDRVVAVLDRTHAGKTVQQVLGFGGDIPVVATMREGLDRPAGWSAARGLARMVARGADGRLRHRQRVAHLSPR